MCHWFRQWWWLHQCCDRRCCRRLCNRCILMHQWWSDVWVHWSGCGSGWCQFLSSSPSGSSAFFLGPLWGLKSLFHFIVVVWKTNQNNDQMLWSIGYWPGLTIKPIQMQFTRGNSLKNPRHRERSELKLDHSASWSQIKLLAVDCVTGQCRRCNQWLSTSFQDLSKLVATQFLQ